MPDLEVVGSLDRIVQVTDSLVKEPWPGFQIDPLAGDEQTIRNTLAAAIGKYIPGFQFNVLLDDYDESGDRPAFEQEAHIDEPEARRMAGIALHVNKGVGTVALRPADPTTFEPARTDNDELEPWYHGDLLEGSTFTVFSEGIQTEAIVVGPTIHRFKSGPGVTRRWRRYTYDSQAHLRSPIVGRKIL